MPTSNENIGDAITLRQIYLLRFGRGMGRRLARILDRAEPELRAIIRYRLERAIRFGGDPGPVVTRRLQRIEQAYREAVRPAWNEIGSLTRSELHQLAFYGKCLCL